MATIEVHQGSGMKASVVSALLMGCLASAALGQEPQLSLRDLESKSPRKLSKDEVTQLMTGAQMSRVSGRGNRHIWTNDGSFIASSDNTGAGGATGRSGRPTTAPGKWHISDDGRYCILIEWRGLPAEEWCRFVLHTSDGYYTTRSDSVGTERVYRFEIGK
jgi:hypothetical protein